MRSLIGQVTVITGAGDGIGRALALEIARHGSSLALSDIDEGKLNSVVSECSNAGAMTRGYVVDVANREAMRTFATEIVRDFSKVNLVINNAGVYLAGTAQETSWENWDWLMGINLNGVVHGSRFFLPHLIASGDGHLVNISSIAGMIAFPYSSAYNASKFAVRGYTEALAQEMAILKLPVNVSCVHPGAIRTNIFRMARQENREDGPALISLFERIARTTPEQAASTIVRGILHNEPRILVGADARLVEAAQRVLGAHYPGVNNALTRWFERHKKRGAA